VDRPLDGITVVSCEQAVAGPFATRQLADLGARVIKIERPGSGDFARAYDETVHGQSSHFVWLNRSKESVVLDLKDASDQTVLHQLIGQADVFVQNLAPGAIDRLGFGAHALRAEQPELIVCNISGYGNDGPMRDAKAYDLLIQAEAGLVSITGTQDEPAKTGIPNADIAGGMYAFSGILTALFRRLRTGGGATVNVNLFDSLIEWMGYPIQYTQGSGAAPQRSGISHAAIAPYGIYSARQGTPVVLSVQNEREWANFCLLVLKQESLYTDPRFASGSLRVENRTAMDSAINLVLKQIDDGEFERRLTAGDIAHACLRDVSDVLSHPQLAARQRWVEVGSPGGSVRSSLPPIDIEGVVPRMDRIPALGENTAAVREEINAMDASIRTARTSI
jgi:crotonobetainyl-CoA:carnitine CoA-transferase CaiB-like acyl-CoA transferase